MKISRKNCDGRRDTIAFYDHFLGPNNVDHLQKLAEIELHNLMYTGESENWNFERFVTAYKERHTLLEG